MWIALFGDRACGDRILRKSATIESVLRKSVAISLALFVGFGGGDECKSHLLESLCDSVAFACLPSQRLVWHYGVFACDFLE
ncbi:hypothetical protein [Helicobacter sp. 10-6591]|uniref:hypothetical protein n=1 Tax=Helicobacter sp. 10-6591 TaxID=2004998 RepID=UPI000DCD73AF|nr:hypothetical protein [Helicobacter sp. 10-6591]RAX52026.1 hypothetical protein CCY97_07870 [Helicobacter sp. 10-6591]